MQPTLSMGFLKVFCWKNGDVTDSFNGFFIRFLLGFGPKNGDATDSFNGFFSGFCWVFMGFSGI